MSETSTYKPDDRLTRAQAAEHLGISTSRLAQLRRSGKIAFEKSRQTREIRFRFADVEELRVARLPERRCSTLDAHDRHPWRTVKRDPETEVLCPGVTEAHVHRVMAVR